MKTCIICLLLTWLVQAQTLTQLEQSWRQNLSKLPGGSGVQSAFSLCDEQGESVLQWESERLLLPASTLKLATTVGILQQGGQTQQLTTRLRMLGQRLRLIGDYDPELSSGDLENLALALIPKIKGPLQLEISPADPQPYPPGWSWDDLSSSFAPPLSALVFDHGLIPLHLQAGEQLQVRGPAWMPPDSLSFMLRPGNFEILAIPGWENWVMAGAITPGTEEAVTVPMLHPQVAAARLLYEVFRRNGVTVTMVPPAPDQGGQAMEVSHRSRPVQQILLQGLADSDNLVMECLYRRFRSTLPTAWIGQNLRVVDGSGLSRYNLVSSQQLLQLLQTQPDLLDYLPKAGKDGTMKRRPMTGQLRAKTGTLSGVSGLVGEFIAVSGRHYRFALLINGFVGPATPFKQAEDSLIAQLAACL